MIDGSPTTQSGSYPDINLSQVRTDLLREKQTIYLEQAKQPYETKRKWIKNIHFLQILIQSDPCH